VQTYLADVGLSVGDDQVFDTLAVRSPDSGGLDGGDSEVKWFGAQIALAQSIMPNRPGAAVRCPVTFAGNRRSNQL
jgi:hypothetical protein